MCTMIYAVLPSDASRNVLAPVTEKYRMACVQIEDKWLPGAPGHLYHATSRHCDCGTVIGSARNRALSEEIGEDIDKKLKELKRAGWKQAKIDRWLAEKDAANAKRHAHLVTTGDAFEVQLAKWMGFLPAILTTGGTDWIGVLYHDYNLGEPAHIEAEVKVPIDHLTLTLLEQMEPDKLYKFVRSR